MIGFAAICALAVVGAQSSHLYSIPVQADVHTQKDPQKSELQGKMWNSIDNYETAKGQYVTSSAAYGDNKVEFQVRSRENAR